ncbi:MAG: hypothetical protein ACPIOQ_66420, partial [Promethearchaeia archaeon]
MWRARHQQKPGDSGRQTVGYFACEEEAAEAITIADAGLRPEDTEVLLNEDEDAGGDGETGLSMGRLLMDPKSAKRLRNQARSAKLESQTNGKKRLSFDHARGRVPGLKSDHGAARNGGCSGAGLASGRSTQPLIGKCWECKAGRFKRNKHCVKTCRGARGSILYARSNAVRG